MPAIVMNVALRTAERDDGAGGPTRSTPPVIDLANSRLRLNFIVPVRLPQNLSKFLAAQGLHLRHGYRPQPPAVWPDRRSREGWLNRQVGGTRMAERYPNSELDG